MAKKKEMDNLAKDAAEALKAGMSYGKWKALQKTVPIKKKEGIPDGWRVCKHCGMPFKPKMKSQIYCEAACQRAEACKKHKAKQLEAMRRYRERKKAGANL